MSGELEIGMRPDGRPLVIPVAALDTHAQILGPTRYGKSMLLANIAQQLAIKTNSCVVVLDPKGDLFWFLKRWFHQHNLSHRLLLIDPSEKRMVCGFNPIRRWDANRELQAAIAVDVFRRALGTAGFEEAPLMARWLFGLHYCAIENNVTMHEMPMIADYNDPRVREVLTARLPDCDVKSDLEWLNGLLSNASQAQMMRLVNEQLGSTLTRLRQYTRNANLRLMLASRERALDWKQVINDRKIVLVNLQRTALADEDQRLLGMQIVSQVIREVFRRESGGEERVPTYLIIDEAQRFCSPEVEQILDEGSGYGLRLILAHQRPAQLVDPKTQDARLRDAVATNARLKIVFGGLPYKSAEEVAWDMWGHTLDPETRKLELTTKAQLHHLEMLESRGRTVAHSTAASHGLVRSRASAYSVAHGHTSAHGDSGANGYSEGAALGTGFNAGDMASFDDAGDVVGRGSSSAAGSSEMFSAGFSHVEGSSDVEAESETESESWVEGEADTESWTEGTTDGRSVTVSPVAVPEEPFDQLSSVQFEPLEEQLHRHICRMIGRPPQEATIALGKGAPVEFRVAHVEEPRLDTDYAKELDLELMRAMPEVYSDPAAIEEEIRDRHRGLLLPAEIVPDVVPASRFEVSAAEVVEGAPQLSRSSRRRPARKKSAA